MNIGSVLYRLYNLYRERTGDIRTHIKKEVPAVALLGSCAGPLRLCYRVWVHVGVNVARVSAVAQ